MAAPGAVDFSHQCLHLIVPAHLHCPPVGAIEGLKSLKQARITDPATGQSFGLVRLYADPGEPAATSAAAAAAHKPARHLAPAGVAVVAYKAAKPPAQRASAAVPSAKPVQASTWPLRCCQCLGMHL